MKTPLNNYIQIDYQLSQQDIDNIYPITPTGLSNIDEQTVQMYPDFNPDMSFEQAISDPYFFIILLNRLRNLKHLNLGTVKQVSKQIADKFSNLEGKQVMLSNIFEINSCAGEKYLIDAETGVIHSLINPDQIMAIINKDQTLTPLHDYVELEFDFPTELQSFVTEKGVDISDKVAGNVETILNLEQIKDFFYEQRISQNIGIVTAVFDKKECIVKVGDAVRVSNMDLFLSRIARADFTKKKLYFIKSEKSLISIEELE